MRLMEPKMDKNCQVYQCEALNQGSIYMYIHMHIHVLSCLGMLTTFRNAAASS